MYTVGTKNYLTVRQKKKDSKKNRLTVRQKRIVKKTV